MGGEQLGDALADVPDSERNGEARERGRLRALEAGDQIRGAFPAIRSSVVSVAASSAKTSDRRLTSPRSTSWSMSFSPSPSTSSAPRLAR